MNYNEKMLKSALWYHNHGFCVFPTSRHKTPFKNFPLEKYLYEKPTKEQVNLWWSEIYPGANIASSMGEVSGMTVFDLDLYDMTDEMKSEVLKLFEDVTAPTAQSPRGGLHLYFQYNKDVPSKAGVLKGFERIDAKNTGGYIMLPPSIGENGDGKEGSYVWIKDKHIKDIPLSFISNTIKSLLYNNYNTIYSKRENELLQLTTVATVGYKIKDGTRDEHLFSIANSLIKGGMNIEKVNYYLQLFALNCCEEGKKKITPKDAQQKVESAIKRSINSERVISEDVREWALTTDGYFLTTDCYRELQLVTPKQKKACSITLMRLKNEGLLEKYGSQRGCYRRVNTEYELIDFEDVGDEDVSLDIRLPFGLEKYVEVYPKDILVFSGQPDAGKTSVMLDMVRLNYHRYNICYFSKEISKRSIKRRINKYDDGDINWKFKISEDFPNFTDILQANAINIIDYIEVNDGEYYKIPGILSKVHEHLPGDSIAIIALQKNAGIGAAIGGQQTLAKPNLFCTIDPDYPNGAIMKVVKAKNPRTDENPKGFCINFKIVKGIKLVPQGIWSPEI